MSETPSPQMAQPMCDPSLQPVCRVPGLELSGERTSFDLLLGHEVNGAEGAISISFKVRR